jgi:Calx-beta domain
LDGTANAGLDYVATQGHIDMRVGQDHVAIPVTILGDKLVEGDVLEVKFGAITLVAVRTIVDNDTLV